MDTLASVATMELWELAARERIRDTLARYNWSGDRLHLDELASAFCVDGALEVRGEPPHRGRAAIVDFFRGLGPATDDRPSVPPGERRIVRHHVTNIRFVALDRDEARVECYFAVLTEIGLDHFGRYRDRLVPVGDEWLIRHRFVSTDWHAPGSTMVRHPLADHEG